LTGLHSFSSSMVRVRLLPDNSKLADFPQNL
jgi:hypothetical protein